MLRADYYSRGQKNAQVIILLCLPLLGGIIVHWFLRLHQAGPNAPDRRFIPQQQEPDSHIIPSRRIDHDET
jgi:hypothetical protein